MGHWAPPLAACGLLWTAAACRAADQAPGLSAERPGYSTSADTMERGYWQVESGFQLTSHAGSLTRSLPAPLFRLGLTKRLEVEAGTDGYVLQDVAAEHSAGVGDVMVGGKVAVWGERKFVPKFALAAGVSLPVGRSELSSAGYDPMVKLCFSKTLPAGFDAGVSVNHRWYRNRAIPAREEAFGLLLGHGVSKRVHAFGEAYRISPVWTDEAVHLAVDGGMTVLLSPNVQLDVSAGRTIRGRTPVWIFGFGVVVRGKWVAGL